MRVNSGADLEARSLSGCVPGASGTTTAAPTATTATDSGAAWTINQWAGFMAIIGGVYGVVLSNTATQVTVDRWYTATNPGGGAAATPASGTYVIIGSAPAYFMALTATAAAPVVTDTVLAGEITTVGGGLIRKSCAYAHTAGTSSYTLTATFTANGTDTLPVIIAKGAIFNSFVGATGVMMFETALNQTATFNASGDQATVTESVTM